MSSLDLPLINEDMLKILNQFYSLEVDSNVSQNIIINTGAEMD